MKKKMDILECSGMT